MSPACACLQGLEAVEVLSLEGCGSDSPASNIFTCDPRILDLGFATLSSSSFGGLSRLAYLEWHAAQDIASLPSTLATLDLSGSNRLGGLPDLERLTGLQQLELSRCHRLAVLPESLSALTGLQQLDLTCCESLAVLPESLGALTGLQQLDLSSGAGHLAALPESLVALTGLQQLDLSYGASL